VVGLPTNHERLIGTEWAGKAGGDRGIAAFPRL